MEEVAKALHLEVSKVSPKDGDLVVIKMEPELIKDVAETVLPAFAEMYPNVYIIIMSLDSEIHVV